MLLLASLLVLQQLTFGAGDHHISEPIIINSHQIISGAGVKATNLILTTKDQKGIVLNSAATIRDMTISSVVEGTTGIFVNAPLAKAQGVRIQNVEILDQEIGIHFMGWVDFIVDSISVAGHKQQFGVLIDNILHMDLTAGVIVNSVFVDPGRDNFPGARFAVPLKSLGVRARLQCSHFGPCDIKNFSGYCSSCDVRFSKLEDDHIIGTISIGGKNSRVNLHEREITQLGGLTNLIRSQAGSSFDNDGLPAEAS